MTELASFSDLSGFRKFAYVMYFVSLGLGVVFGMVMVLQWVFP